MEHGLQLLSPTDKKVLLKKVPIKKGTLVFNAGDRRHFFCKQRMEASVDQGIYIWGRGTKYFLMNRGWTQSYPGARVPLDFKK
jgi:hypothetical protein